LFLRRGHGIHDNFVLPVTMASNESSLSKLKLLQTYFRAAGSHDRTSNLGILSIERYRFFETVKFLKYLRRERRAKLTSYSHQEIKVDIFQQANIPT